MGSNTEFLRLANTVWKTNFERASLSHEFKPSFCRIIGFEDEGEYNSILKFLYKKAEETESCVFFADEIPVSFDFDMLMSISSELSTMGLSNLEHADIIMFDSNEYNHAFLCALNHVTQSYESMYGFQNKSVKVDFITKLILWTYEYLRPIQDKLNESTSPTCLYYGSIGNHEKFFLYMLHLMCFDVLYINPLRDEMADFSRDICEMELINYPRIAASGSILDRINHAKDTNVARSTTVELMDEIQENIFNGSGVYRPWQLKDFVLHPLKRKLTIYDVTNNINEPARVRSGFATTKSTVEMPNIFFQFDGIPDELEEYTSLYESCVSSENKLLCTDLGAKFVDTAILSEEAMLQLVFCKSTASSYDIVELRKIPGYTWNRFNESIERKLVDALNRIFSDNVLSHSLSQEEEFSLVGKILSVPTEIIKMLDNYDYSRDIPKVIFFLENDYFILPKAIQVLSFIYELGFDIIIFNPSGLMSISSEINPDVFSSHRFDRMVYDMTIERLKSGKKSKGFFSFLFQ